MSTARAPGQLARPAATCYAAACDAARCDAARGPMRRGPRHAHASVEARSCRNAQRDAAQVASDSGLPPAPPL
eukprot:1107009-Alexandrium_andersonii.AAC.1